LGYGKYYEIYEGLRKKYPDLYVVSNFLGGSSLAKCIERATKTAEEILKAF
jgi:protoporphyrinogen oxidase